METNLRTMLGLHLLLVVYSMTGVFSKLAASTVFFSLQFCLYYAGIIALLGVYAVGWQQFLKRMPLTTAFSAKAVTVVWGIIWGALFFCEPITWQKALGAALIIVGVVLFAHADSSENIESGDLCE